MRITLTIREPYTEQQATDAARTMAACIAQHWAAMDRNTNMVFGHDDMWLHVTMTDAGNMSFRQCNTQRQQEQPR